MLSLLQIEAIKVLAPIVMDECHKELEIMKYNNLKRRQHDTKAIEAYIQEKWILRWDIVCTTIYVCPGWTRHITIQYIFQSQIKHGFGPLMFKLLKDYNSALKYINKVAAT